MIMLTYYIYGTKFIIVMGVKSVNENCVKLHTYIFFFIVELVYVVLAHVRHDK